MIRNLNPLSFRQFGTVLATTPAPVETPPEDARQHLRLTRSDRPMYRCADDLWLSGGSATMVLSVSTDAEQFYHYYLDKTVCLQKDTVFFLSPLREEAVAEVWGAQPPQQLEKKAPPVNYLLRRQTGVESLYTFFYQEKERGFLFPGESHPMLELTYVDLGTLHSVADGNDLLLEQGDMVLYAPDQWHMQYADIGVAPRFVTVSFTLKGALPEDLFDRKLKAPQEALALIQGMLREQERMDAHSGDMILSLLEQLLVVLSRGAADPVARPKLSNTVHTENRIIRSAQQYIGSHVRSRLSVPSVAKAVDVSPSYLTALFHKHLQISPGEYIRRIKLQESKQLIRENSMNFTQIAQALQYSTVHHFSRQFKEKFGITPSEYARSVR